MYIIISDHTVVARILMAFRGRRRDIAQYTSNPTMTLSCSNFVETVKRSDLISGALRLRTAFLPCWQ